MNKKRLMLMMLAASLAAGPVVAAPENCVVLSGTIIDTGVACTLRQAMDRNTRSLKIVQFGTTPTAADREALTSAGATILGVVPENALLVRTTADLSNASANVSFVGDYLPEFALAGELVGLAGTEEPQRVHIVLADGPSLDADLEWIVENAEIDSLSNLSIPGANKHLLTCDLPGTLLEACASLDSTLRVETAKVELLPTGERSSLVVAGQTYFDGNVEKALAVGDSLPGKTNDYLTFLASRLTDLDARVADHTASREYPPVTFIDDGLDPFTAYLSSTPTPGQRLIADNPDLYTFGDVNNESRIISAFNYNFGTGTIPTVIDGAPVPPNGVDSFGYEEISEQGIQMSAISHTAATTSLLAGYNAGSTNADLDGTDPTQYGTFHRYGIGVSPYGRIAGANFAFAPSVLGQYYPPPTDPQPAPIAGFFQPNDFTLMSAEIQRRVRQADGYTGGAALTNDSFVIFPIGAGFDCSGLNEQPLRPPIAGKTYHSYRTTSDNDYDLYSQRFDQLTRSTYFWEDEDTLRVEETLYVAAAGNQGFFIPGRLPSEHCPFPAPLPPVIPNADGQAVPGMGAMVAPALAKNVLTVGGSEIFNPVGDIEFCGSVVDQFDEVYASYLGFEGNTSGQDIMTNSGKGRESFGRPNDIRIKPEIVAPSSGVIYNAVRDPRDFGDGVRAAGCEDFTNAIRAFSPDAGDFVEEFTPCLECILPAFRGALWLIPSITFFRDVVVDGDTVRIYQDDDHRIYTRPAASGTSAAAPQVSGALQVAGYFMRNQYGVEDPSAALYKAFAIHTARMLDGEHTGPYRVLDPENYTFDVEDRQLMRIPNPYQGFGRIDMDMGLDSTARYFVNQEFVLGENGPKSFTIAGKVEDPNKPVRVALVWTDPPAEAGADVWEGSLVNDLDLIVSTYDPKKPFFQRLKFFVGNLFQEPEADVRGGHICHSEDVPLISFGSGGIQLGFGNDVDSYNNTEAVFLAPKFYNDESSIGKKSTVTITVLARDLAGNALNPYDPASGEYQQDFALVAYNFIPQTPPILLGN